MIERIATVAIALTILCAPLGARAATPATSLSPVLSASEGWLNSKVGAARIRGKVVLVDVFTFGCFNCKNVVPNLRVLQRKYSADVVIIGVHSPETPFEKDRANVVENLKAQAITWPVAIDNSFAIWNAYGIDAWPTQLLFDRQGRLRKTIVGDSQDAAVDTTIARLVAEE